MLLHLDLRLLYRRVFECWCMCPHANSTRSKTTLQKGIRSIPLFTCVTRIDFESNICRRVFEQLRRVHRWNRCSLALLDLLVQKYLLTGIKVQILKPEELLQARRRWDIRAIQLGLQVMRDAATRVSRNLCLLVCVRLYVCVCVWERERERERERKSESESAHAYVVSRSAPTHTLVH